MTEITAVNEQDKKQINEFINYPYTLYKDNPYWIGELKADVKKLLLKDPFWRHAEKQMFIAYKNGKAAGRIMALVNHTHNEHWNEKCGMFGFFDCIDDAGVAKALLTAAKNWTKEKGQTVFRGPFSPSTNHMCGVLVHGFDKEPVIMMPYNFEYYDRLITAAGLVKAKDLLAFGRTKENSYSARIKKITQRIKKNSKITIRPLMLKSPDSPDVEAVRTIYNNSWAKNYCSLPINKEEMTQIAKNLIPVVNVKGTGIAELDGAPVAFFIAMSDMNKVLKELRGSIANPLRVIKALNAWRKIKGCRMLMLGVLPECRGRGTELMLIDQFIEEGIKLGWTEAELGWVLEDNRDMVTVIEEVGCYPTKRYRLYESAL